jgi:hypothetical protein
MSVLSKEMQSRKMKAQYEDEMRLVDQESKIRSVKERIEEADRIHDALHDLMEDLGELAWEEELAYDRVFSQFQGNPLPARAQERAWALNGYDKWGFDGIIPWIQASIRKLEAVYDLERY